MLEVNWHPDRRTLRQFAAISLVGFGLIGSLVLRQTESMGMAVALWTVGGTSFAVGLPWPNAIRPLYVVLTAATLPIGLVVSAVMLRVIFYGLFTPLGLFFRCIGRDPLLLRRPAAADSYWQPRTARHDVAAYWRQT